MWLTIKDSLPQRARWGPREPPPFVLAYDYEPEPSRLRGVHEHAREIITCGRSPARLGLGRPCFESDTRSLKLDAWNLEKKQPVSKKQGYRKKHVRNMKEERMKRWQLVLLIQMTPPECDTNKNQYDGEFNFEMILWQTVSRCV